MQASTKGSNALAFSRTVFLYTLIKRVLLTGPELDGGDSETVSSGRHNGGSGVIPAGNE